MNYKLIEVWGSLQAHRSVQKVDGGGYGICPTIGTTDFGLPRLVFKTSLNEQCSSETNRKYSE